MGGFMGEILRVEHLRKQYPVRDGQLRALDGVTFTLPEGQTLGIVGESGCGKSTLARLICGLEEPTSGGVTLGGVSLKSATRVERRRLTRFCQMVYQDPMGSLNPRQRVHDIVGEPLRIHKAGTGTEQERRVRQLLHRVGLPADAGDRYPHAFSGGQRQRIAIARALALRPRLLVADEPVSALDVSVQAQVLNLLADLRESLGLTLIVVSHDLSVVRWIADRVMVMYLGKVVEEGPCDDVFLHPQHPYTRALIASAPVLPGVPSNQSTQASTTSALQLLGGEVPSAIRPPSGCHFHPRCSLRQPHCDDQAPELLPDGNGRLVSCHDVHGFPSLSGDLVGAPTTSR